MRRLVVPVSLATAAMLMSGAWAAGQHGQHAGHGKHAASPYAGQEKRSIKSLSPQDIDDLRNGRGWGLAKAAELNGIPGPVHVLELKGKIPLSADQINAIERQFADMKARAIPLGRRLVELESSLNQDFARRDIDRDRLKARLDEIARVRSELRFVHLEAHLRTPEILTPHQIAAYNRLRGYDAGPEAGPHGHN